jgi:toxin ParE1/3/4
MSRVELAPEILDDFDRILQHLLDHDVPEAAERIRDIMSAIDVLAVSPLIGRARRSDLRELVIGRGAGGYIVLYRYLPELDTVFVLAIRGQKEAGYPRP